MWFAASLAVLPLISVATAQKVYQVTVGSNDTTKQLTFQPYALAASVGDVVQFVFQQKNHSVTQTSFDNVCHPLLDEYYNPVFDSGFQAVAADQTSDFPTYNYTVKDTTPVWLYCKQKGHCGQGMVFSINCPATGDHSFDNFKQAALAFGVKEKAEQAAKSSWVATATSDVYGSQTYAPVWHPTVTDTVTFQNQTWTTVYESYENSPAPTPVAEKGVEHRIKVGDNGTLTYSPSKITANVRDTIVFEFLTKNHTATQSSFGDPCRKLFATTGKDGFDSGFMPVDPASNAPPTFTITVNDTSPIWVYCRQTAHCGKGMVFAVNSDESPESSRTFDNFVKLAKLINGTSSDSNSNSTGETSSNNKGAAPSVRASIASVALFAVSGLFVLAF
jgi:plastocyanin